MCANIYLSHKAINKGQIPWSSTTYSNIVSPSLMGGKSRALWCFARNSSIFARSSSSSNAPKLHIRANMNSFSKWKAGRVPLSSFLGIKPSSKLQAFKNQHTFHKNWIAIFLFLHQLYFFLSLHFTCMIWLHCKVSIFGDKVVLM